MPVGRADGLPRIRLQFTALYATTLLLVLLAAAGTLRFALRAVLEREFTKSVAASAALVSQFFRAEIAEYQTIDATLTHIAGELVFEERAIRMRRPDGTYFRVGGAPVVRSRTPLPTPLKTVQVPLDPSLAPGWQIEVDASAANVRALQARIDRWFAFGIPILVLFAALVGWWLTGRTLRPVSRALAQQRQFIADAAHELRTPIARMRARVEVAQLEQRSSGDDTPPGFVDALSDELVAASRQVDELLQLARADAAGNDVPLQLEPFFLDDLVADELPRWQPEAQRVGVQLSHDVLEETAVVGDAVLLRRLLSVLLDNAIRYSRADGHVRVRVAPHGAMARLEIEDDGIGVPDHEHTRIFDRFFRGDEARKVRADGSGLGLAIAAWIATRHRGSITVSNVTPRGTCMTVDLPIARG